jgi:predicted DCC family thiol-disulfide oxidoreductase YuxK
VFYDGECGLCDRFIQRLIRADKAKRIRYATLQGETAKEFVGEPAGEAENWSVKLLDSTGIYSRSSAALRSMAHAGGIWKLSTAFLLVPTPIRDGVYRWVARHRYSWFGKRDACMIPAPALRERFLP